MDRYSRQVRVAGIGAEGQSRLRDSHVLVVGCGALGTHATDALARAGIGTLSIVDRDIVEWSNLQRQVLFTEADARAGTPKAVAAAARLHDANSECRVLPHVADCSLDFLQRLPIRPHVVLDGTDNFATRYLLNDWCARERLPWIYAGAVGSEAAALVVPPGGPCLRCLWPEPPVGGDVGTCETAGILAPAIAVVAAFQVAETLKLLLGVAPATGVFTCDVWRARYELVGLAAQPAPDCPTCCGTRYPALAAPPSTTVTLCGRDAVQIDLPRPRPLDLEALAARLRAAAADVERTPHLLRFAADGCRFSVFPGGRALLFGVTDPLRARALYDRWIGTS